jgi:hypothetical protein
MVSRFAENRLQQQWRSLIIGSFDRDSSKHLFKDCFYAFSAHVDSGHQMVWVEVRKYQYVPEISTSSFLFLGNGTPANSAAGTWLLEGNLLTFFCNLWLQRRAHTHNLFLLRACYNGNPIKI